MKILIVGATGMIGSAVCEALQAGHEVVRVSHSRAAQTVDLADPDSIRRLYSSIGRVDAVLSASGKAAFRPLFELTDADFALSLSNKLMGQINLVRLGIEMLADGGSFTLTSGILSRHPMSGGAAVSVVNAAIEGFVRSAALELPRGIRINAVAPGMVRESLVAKNKDPSGGVPVAQVVLAYLRSVEGATTGQVFDAVAGDAS